MCTEHRNYVLAPASMHQAMGQLEYFLPRFLVEKDPVMQKFLNEAWPEAAYIIADLASFKEETVADVFSKTSINLLNRASPDCVVAGLPCPPYSSARSHKKSQEPPSSHRDFKAVEDFLRSYLPRMRPLGGLCENVEGFGHMHPELASEGHGTYQEQLENSLRAMGYAVHTFKTNLLDWNDVSRPRRPCSVIVLSMHSR